MPEDIRELIKPGGFPFDELLSALRNHVPTILKPQFDGITARLDAIDARLSNIEKKLSKG